MFYRPLVCLSLLCSSALVADEPSIQNERVQFKPFTGRVTGNKVRMRTKPTLDAPIVKELRAGDLFIVSGETEEFLCVPPTDDVHAYVHRKFILDGSVDGSRVNVRLSPTTDAPVIAQLNTGDKIDGKKSAENPKWLEFSPPDFVQFYVAKDYIENIGGPEVLLRLQKKTTRINRLLTDAKNGIQKELNKPFDQMDLDEHMQDLVEVSKESEEFPVQAGEAKLVIRQTNDKFLQKKIAYLESMTKNSRDNWNRKNEELKYEIAEQTRRMENIESKYTGKSFPKAAAYERQSVIQEPKTPEMSAWESVENEQFQKWSRNQKGVPSIEAFYNAEGDHGSTVRGVLTPYNHSVKGRPGDYMLLSESSKAPTAYLYSTKVNLSEHIGQPVTLRVAKRSNRNFAFPAYYVLFVEQ